MILAMVACGKDDSAAASGSDYDADNTEASASSSQLSRIDQMLIAPVSSQDPTTAAQSLSQANQWWPASCATRAKDAADPKVVHVTLDNCSGPFGIAKWTGEFTVTFSANADGSLHAETTSSNMTLNGNAVTFTGSRDITVSGSSRTATGSRTWTRVNAKGETVTHEATGTVVLDTSTGCRTANGTATTKVALRELDSTVTDFVVCREPDDQDACPSSGKLTTTAKRTGKTVTIEFDGSNQAKVTGPNGGSIDVTLICTPVGG